MSTLVVLTGAGISAESGLATFRDNNGLWCNHRVEDVATPEAFARNPKLVHDFYNMRRAQLKEAAPNAAHIALAELAQTWKGKFLLVTQNVDDLHERATCHPALVAGSPAPREMPQQVRHDKHFQLMNMHGELKKVRCEVCEEVQHWEEELGSATPCPSCTRVGYMRPHIVWFGEMPFSMDLIHHYLQECDLFLSIVTSGNVYPAAGFVHEVRMYGKGKCVELNMEQSSGYNLFHEGIYGPATKIVPEYLQKLLKETA